MLLIWCNYGVNRVLAECSAVPEGDESERDSHNPVRDPGVEPPVVESLVESVLSHLVVRHVPVCCIPGKGVLVATYSF